MCSTVAPGPLGPRGLGPPLNLNLTKKRQYSPLDRISQPLLSQRGDPWLFSTVPPSLANLQAPLVLEDHSRIERMIPLPNANISTQTVKMTLRYLRHWHDTVSSGDYPMMVNLDPKQKSHPVTYSFFCFLRLNLQNAWSLYVHFCGRITVCDTTWRTIDPPQ